MKPVKAVALNDKGVHKGEYSQAWKSHLWPPVLCVPLIIRTPRMFSNPPAMLEPLIGFGVLLSSPNAVVHFSMPPQVEKDPPTNPPTYDYANMIFNDTTTCNCQEFDFINNKNDCYNDQPTDAHCGIIKQELMSRPALKYEYRFKDAVRDPGLRKAISDAINTTYGVTYGAFGWPCKAEGIQELDAKNMGIADANGGLTGIENLTGLKRIWLDGNIDIKGLYNLQFIDSLEEVYLKDCTCIAYQGRPLKNLPTLKKLDMSGVLGYQSSFTTLNLTLNSGHVNLNVLKLSGCANLTDEGITILKDLPALTEVDLSCCTKLTNLQPLIDNTNFRDGDRLDVSGIPNIDNPSSVIYYQIHTKLVNEKGVVVTTSTTCEEGVACTLL